MELRILGPLEVAVAGQALPLAGPKQRAVLALLVLNANEVVPRDRLIDDLWGDEPPAEAAATLRVYVARLRKILSVGNGAAPALEAFRNGYILRVAPELIDLNRFDALVAEGETAVAAGRTTEASERLAEALAVWRGPALADLGDEPGVRREAGRLEELRLRALEKRIDADLTVGRHPELVAELEALVAAEPYRERFAAQLMVALYRCGRQPDALRVYARLRTRLHEDFALEPTHALRELERQILAQDPALDVANIEDRQRGPGAPRARRLSRLGLAAGAVVLVLVVLGALLAFSLSGLGSEEPAALARVDLNSVGVIDPKRNELVGQVRVGARPTRIAYGENALWVTNADDRTVSRIVSWRSREPRAVRLDHHPTDVAVGDAMVWIAAGRRANIARAGYVVVGAAVVGVDPEFRTIAKQIRLPTTQSLTLPKIAVGDSGLWVAHVDQLYRLSPDGGRIVSRITIDPATDIAVGARAVWTSYGLSGSAFSTAGGTLSRIDPATEAVTATIELGSGASAVAVGEEAVWVGIEGAVLRINPETAVVQTTIPVQGVPSDIAVGEGAVWVAMSDLGTVARINPETDRVVATIRLGNRPDGIAVGAGKVWVTVY